MAGSKERKKMKRRNGSGSSSVSPPNRPPKLKIASRSPSRSPIRSLQASDTPIPVTSSDPISNHPKTNPSTSSDSPLLATTHYLSPFSSPNPFSALTVETEGNQSEKKEGKPPPIFVKGINNYIAFKKALEKELKENEFTCKSRLNDIVLHPETPDGYRLAVHYLRSMKAEFHTYQLREDRAFRVVIRHLHHTTPPADIQDELEAMGFKVRTVTNAKSVTSKEPLPLFFVDLDPQDGNEKIYSIKRLLRSVVKIEEPHKRNTPPQCTRCQNYNHTKAYCNYPPRCVKCAGTHFSYECQKSRDVPATCALCSGSHPANYRGCTAYAELKKKTKSTSSRPSKSTAAPDVQSSIEFPALRPAIQPSPLDDGPEIQPQCGSQMIPSTSQQSYAQVSHRLSKSNTNHVPPPNTSFDFSSQFNNFVQKIESLLTPLITLLTTIVSSLLPSMSVKQP